jgi:SNF2 family DNA or RNA helicase
MRRGIYFLILYNLFSEFLEEIDEDFLPNDRTGYQDSVVWKKLFNYQRDAATGIINKLETYNGCILADSVGLGKRSRRWRWSNTMNCATALSWSCVPRSSRITGSNYNKNLKTNIFAKDRFSYDVLCHTDLSRTSGESLGMPLSRVNWGNYDLVVIDESHNFRNNDIYKDKETRYQKLMNQVIRAGVKTKVLMLSATPVNNRFTDLRNQLALAYEGQSENLSKQLKSKASIEEIFRKAQTVFNVWSKLLLRREPPARSCRCSTSISSKFWTALRLRAPASTSRHSTIRQTSDRSQNGASRCLFIAH